MPIDYLILSIFIRNKKIVWKHRLNRLFYAFILRTKLYLNPFVSTGHQNVSKPNSRVVGLFMDLLFYLHMRQI